MFRLALNAVLCLLVLACPAWGGRCCGGVSEFQPQATSPEQTGSDGCGACCERHQSTDSPLPDSHDCRTCFCTGALPDSTSAVDVTADVDLVVGFVQPLSFFCGVDASTDRLDARLSGISPRAGRLMLTLYCTLLL